MAERERLQQLRLEKDQSAEKDRVTIIEDDKPEGSTEPVQRDQPGQSPTNQPAIGMITLLGCNLSLFQLPVLTPTWWYLRETTTRFIKPKRLVSVTQKNRKRFKSFFIYKIRKYINLIKRKRLSYAECSARNSTANLSRTSWGDQESLPSPRLPLPNSRTAHQTLPRLTERIRSVGSPLLIHPTSMSSYPRWTPWT